MSSLATLIYFASRFNRLRNKAKPRFLMVFVSNKIDNLEKTSIETVQYTDYEERFTQWAAAGGGVLLLELLLSGIFFRRAP